MKISVSNMRRLSIVAGFAMSGAGALAGFTTINGPATGEDSLNTIFDTIYAQTFAPSGNDFIGNGGVTLTRVDDFGIGGAMHIAFGVPGGADDQLWNDGAIYATAEAKFAADEQKFGYIGGHSGGSYTNLFDVSGGGYAVTGDNVALIGPNFRWARNGGGIGGLHSSQDSDNVNDGDGPNGRDHLITYKVTGLNNGATATWLLCWEDRNTGQPNGDFDFNDLVVEVIAMPTPMAAGLGLLGLTGVVGVRRRAVR